MEESHVNSFAVSFDNNRLTYCGQDCQRIPPALWKMYGGKVRYLDLSFNSIETLRGLEHFPRLEELILDNNKLGDGASFPHLPHLKTLSLNNNQISDLEGLVNKISECFPSLSYLSLLSNKACPNQLSDLDKDESDYQRYRSLRQMQLQVHRQAFRRQPIHRQQRLVTAQVLQLIEFSDVISIRLSYSFISRRMEDVMQRKKSYKLYFNDFYVGIGTRMDLEA